MMVVMLGGMVVAFVVIVHRLPPELSLRHAVSVAGTLGRMNVVDFSPDLGNRYTFWSGLTGGCFLAMAYFGTDQSQVQRYLSGRSVTESRLGLLFNGLLKVPMQALILFVGVMVFVFYQFNAPPLFFNEAELARVAQTPRAAEMRALDVEHRAAFATKRLALSRLTAALDGHDAAAIAEAQARVRCRWPAAPRWFARRSARSSPRPCRAARPTTPTTCS